MVSGRIIGAWLTGIIYLISPLLFTYGMSSVQLQLQLLDTTY